MRQIPLSVQLKDSAVFDTCVAGRNAEAVAFLQRLTRPRLPPDTNAVRVSAI